MPIQGVVRSLDPSLTATVEQADVLPSVFETLTWAAEGTRIVPWLASEVLMENDGARFRFRLQPGVRFHNGRRLTARDVRHSWERLLLNRESEIRWLLSVIQGAQRLLDGRSHGSFRLPHRVADRVLRGPREARPLLPRDDLLRRDGDRPGGHRRDRRERARGRRRNGALPRRQLRARPPARARAQSHTTGAPGARGARASSSTSASRPRRSATNSSPAGCRSRAISCRPTPRPSGTTRASPRATARARA